MELQEELAYILNLFSPIPEEKGGYKIGFLLLLLCKNL